ncbi:hypothetical protein DY000_02010204 [Brassica cretica]|uniref:Uncharacterized protein n=1 Tax=Brassica cretica TaxID=69181 RepID=A0ABQ7CAD0_BRACR|nr:hypothetical protein DY000_02010204 [Brassica cretica]
MGRVKCNDSAFPLRVAASEQATFRAMSPSRCSTRFGLRSTPSGVDRSLHQFAISSSVFIYFGSSLLCSGSSLCSATHGELLFRHSQLSPAIRTPRQASTIATSDSPGRETRPAELASSFVVTGSRPLYLRTVISDSSRAPRLQIIAPPLNHKSSIAVLRRHRYHLSRRGGCRNRHNQVSPSGFRSGEEKLFAISSSVFIYFGSSLLCSGSSLCSATHGELLFRHSQLSPAIRTPRQASTIANSDSPGRETRPASLQASSSLAHDLSISAPREFPISTVKSKHGFTRRLQIIAPPLNHKSSIAVLRRHRDHLSRRGGCRNRQNQVSPSGFRSDEEKLVSFNGGFFNIAKPVPDLLYTFNSDPDFGICRNASRIKPKVFQLYNLAQVNIPNLQLWCLVL